MSRIILIGFMGSGKTTLGKQLAKQMTLPFVDSDQLIEKIEGMPVSEIFEKHGETYFREREKEILLSIEEISDMVLSVGGGLPCQEDRMELLNKLGTTIYLRLMPEILFQRLENEREKRPLLKDVDLLQFIVQKLEEREVYYNKAQIILDVEDQTVDGVLKSLEILQKS